MALYAIGDLHLSLGADKPMDVFGGPWENYVEKIRLGFSALHDDDVCVLCGDLAWGMTMEQALPDFQFIEALPGKKILLKGNHDFWWSTAKKAYDFFEAHDMHTMDILNNNCYFYGDYAICGTRGWFYEEAKGEAHDRKIMLREVGRLEASLKAAGDKTKLVFCTTRRSIWATSARRSWHCSMPTMCRCAVTGISTAAAAAAPFRGCIIIRSFGCCRRTTFPFVRAGFSRETGVDFEMRICYSI